MLHIAFCGLWVVKGAFMLLLEPLCVGPKPGDTGVDEGVYSCVQIHGPHPVPWSVVNCGMELLAVLLPSRTNPEVPPKNPPQPPAPHSCCSACEGLQWHPSWVQRSQQDQA